MEFRKVGTQPERGGTVCGGVEREVREENLRA